jgi:uncharacterized protein with GYD domain
MAGRAGASFNEIYWTLGSHDVVAMCDAPHHETATALSLGTSLRGNIRSETLRAVPSGEMKQVLGTMV